MPPMRGAPPLDVFLMTLGRRGGLALPDLDRAAQPFDESARVGPPRAVERRAAARAAGSVLVEEALQPRDLRFFRRERLGAFGEPASGLRLGEPRDAHQARDAVGTI